METTITTSESERKKKKKEEARLDKTTILAGKYFSF